MKDFEVFVKSGEVKKQKPDKNLAKSLINDSKKRLSYAKKDKITQDNSKFIFENAYEAVREAADSIMALKGYKSYSHEATISFLQRFPEFTISELSDFDRFRYIRNGLKYYGKDVSMEETHEMIRFATPMIKKLSLLYKKVSEK